MNSLDQLRECCAPLLQTPLAFDQASELAAVLKALADPVRLQLVSIIASSGEACACDLPARVGKSQPTTSHHLSQLVAAGVLTRTKRGRWAWFSVNERQLSNVCQLLGTSIEAS